MRNDVAKIFEEIAEKRKISVDAFENIIQCTLLQNGVVPKFSENENEQNDTVMLYKNRNKKRRAKSHSPPAYDNELGPSNPKKSSIFSSSLVPENNAKNNRNVETNFKSEMSLSEKRSNANKARFKQITKKKEKAKQRGEESGKARKKKSLEMTENTIILQQIAMEPVKHVTPPNSVPYKSSGASSLPAKLTPIRQCMEKKEREQQLIKDLQNAMSIAINENIKLLKSNEEFSKKLKEEQRKSKELSDINIDLTNKLLRKSLPKTSSRVPYPNLTPRGKAAVVDRIRKLLEEDNPLYTDLDFEEILHKAFPNLFQKFNFNVEETAEFQLQAGLTRRKMEKVRMMFKRKFKRDIFASRKDVAVFRKNVKEECSIKYFDQDGVMGAVLSDVVKAITLRIQRQKKSGTFILNSNEKFQVCVVEDKGGDYTSIGIIFNSLWKRNSPDAMLFAGIYKGNESRENLIVAFKGHIYDKLNNLKFITVDNERIEIEIFKIADLKMLKIFNGIRQGNAKHSCIVCTLPNDKTFLQLLISIFEKRNFNIINKDICQDDVTLMSSIDSDHIVLPLLHIYLGIVSQIIKIMVMELRRIEFDLEKNFAEDADENENEEELESLQDQLIEAEELQEQWKLFFQHIDIRHEDAVDDDDEFEDDDGFCMASNCIVKITNMPLPERITHTAQPTPSILKCKRTKQFYHTVCVGMNSEAAKNQKKRDFVADEVCFDTVKKVVEEEIKEARIKVINVQDKIKKEYYKNMMPENESRYVKVLENIFKKFGATKQLYYQEYNGNHIRLIVKNATSIIENLVDPETKRNIGNDKIRACCVALDILKRIQDKTEARLLEDHEIDEVVNQIDLYKNHMQNHFPNLSVTHKNHMFIRHVPDYAKKWRTIGLFSEAPIEHQHKINKQRLRLIATTDEHKKCEFLLKSNWEKNYLIDIGNTLL
uniref:Uncharacterized protein n=1 Tax=Panagrolaimus sp. PS1159 TaxID=55785 RepID=A0AC35FDT5_9BILA